MIRYGYGFNEDTYRCYISEILRNNNYKLTPEEEYEIARKAAQGDKKAREKLIKCNLKLVIKIAVHFLIPGVSLMDLIQEGNIGLITAVDKFNYKRNVRFSTYASNWIKQAILRFLIKNLRGVKLPLRKGEMLLRIEKELNKLVKILNRTPTIDEISNESGIEKRKVKELLNCIPPALSLNDDIKQNYEASFIPIYFNNEGYHPEKIALRNLLKEETDRILNSLLERESIILRYRFGLYDGKKYSLKQTGKIIGLSAESIRQIEIKALEKLRKKFASLREYLDI